MDLQILFVQGAGEGTHDTWDNKLVASLEAELGTRVRYPRMPDEADPRYAKWKPALVAELNKLDDGAILVGHSTGGAVLLHVLAEERLRFKPRAIVTLAAPFIGDGGWPSDDLPARTDFNLLAAIPVFLFHGTADTTAPFHHVELYAKAIPHAVVHALEGRDHQLNNDLREVASSLR